MADTTPASSPAPDSSTSPSTESKAQRDARLRRERRNAKIQAEGSSRLSKITSLSGRPAAAEAELNRTPPSKPETPSQKLKSGDVGRGSGRAQPDASGDAADPDEVDITNMFQRPPKATGEVDQQALFRQMLRANGDGPQGTQQQQQEDDPMMRMMQQMLGSMGGDPNQAGGGLPPGLADMLGGQMGAGAQHQQQQQQPPANDYVWRIVHPLVAFLIGAYAVSSLSFTGSSLSRSEYVTDSIGPRLFYLFATAEVVLQSGRYFMDRGRLPKSGWLGKIAQFLPEPYAGYLRVLERYGVIYTTVVSDALVVVFVLGICAWWKGLAGA